MTRLSETARTPAARRGFSLIELLTVIAIIALLIAILLPVLGAVRSSGDKASTSSMLTGLNQAAASFELDNRRQPGYFSADELGSTDNYAAGGPGLTQMENAMLDLAGADAITTTAPADPTNWIEVNPSANANRTIWVQTSLIGAGEGGYFTPDQASLAYMDAQQQPCTINSQSVGNNVGLPDLIDAFGQPILAWVENENASTAVRSADEFASYDSNTQTALYYWTANGSMLSSPLLGELQEDMTRAPVAGSAGSLIGSGVPAAQVDGVMAALLGHPGYPDEAMLASGDYSNIFPTRPRGAFVAHSAGPDGIFLGAGDGGAGRILGTGMLGGGNLNITYGVNFFNSASSGDRRLNDQQQPETIDFIDAFDDIVVAQ